MDALVLTPFTAHFQSLGLPKQLIYYSFLHALDRVFFFSSQHGCFGIVILSSCFQFVHRRHSLFNRWIGLEGFLHSSPVQALDRSLVSSLLSRFRSTNFATIFQNFPEFSIFSSRFLSFLRAELQYLDVIFLDFRGATLIQRKCNTLVHVPRRKKESKS